MTDTCGHYGDTSSRSADLQSSLENRLQARLGGGGSPLFVLTWKHWDMPSGLPICALRASARRTAGPDYGSWPTPTARDCTTSRNLTKTTLAGSKRGNPGLTLTDAATFVGWAKLYGPTHAGLSLRVIGKDAPGFPAQTARLGQLSPEHSRWLMGYPIEWGSCAGMATPSCRRSRRSS